MKTLSLFTCAIFAASVGHAATAPDYSALHKDVTILTKILQTAAEPDSKSRTGYLLHHPRIEGMYLARQGMVFNIEVRGGVARNWLGFMAQNMASNALLAATNASPATPATPALPLSAISSSATPAVSGINFDFDSSPEMDDIERFVDDFMEDYGSDDRASRNDPVRAQMQAKLNELRKTQELYEKQVEAQEEALSELEEKANSGDKTQREKTRAALEKSRDALKKSRDQFRNTINQFRSEQGKRWKEQLTQLQGEMLNTLCNYASSARRLPNNENVTLIFRNATTEEGGNHQIFILGRSDLDACISSNQADGFLHKRAIIYTE